MIKHKFRFAAIAFDFTRADNTGVMNTYRGNPLYLVYQE